MHLVGIVVGLIQVPLQEILWVLLECSLGEWSESSDISLANLDYLVDCLTAHVLDVSVAGVVFHGTAKTCVCKLLSFGTG